MRSVSVFLATFAPPPKNVDVVGPSLVEVGGFAGAHAFAVVFVTVVVPRIWEVAVRIVISLLLLDEAAGVGPPDHAPHSPPIPSGGDGGDDVLL